MNDVIPGARYYDRTFDLEWVCNGVYENNDGERKVKLEHKDRGAVEVSYDVFREEDYIELIETPE